MKTIKGIRILLVCLLTVFFLTGCLGEKHEIVVGEDGKCSYKIMLMAEREAYDAYEKKYAGKDEKEGFPGFAVEDFEQEIKEISGMSYRIFTRTFSFGSVEELRIFLTDSKTYYNTFTANSKNKLQYMKDQCLSPYTSLEISENGFYGRRRESDLLIGKNKNVCSLDLKGRNTIFSAYKALGVLIEETVTLPYAIMESNGAVSGKTVCWDNDNWPDDGKMVAAVGLAKPISSDKTPPIITGVRNGTFYRKTVFISASDNVSLPSLRLNGKSYGTCSYKITDSGKYTLEAKDANNNTAKVSFVIDKQKPVIRGAKNGRTYKNAVRLRFFDNDKIKTVRVNGKAVNRKKIKLTKKKKYVVKAIDRAGNKKEVRFKIG